MALVDAPLRPTGDRLRCVHRFLVSMNRRHGRPLLEHDVEDLAQDTVIVILRKLPEFEGRSRLETWVHRVCQLEFRGRLRDQRRQRGRFEGLDDGPEPGIMAPVHDFWQQERLLRTLDALGSPRARIVRLKELEQQSFDEICAQLDMPRSTVRSHYYRALAWLRERLRAVDCPAHAEDGPGGPRYARPVRRGRGLASREPGFRARASRVA